MTIIGDSRKDRQSNINDMEKLTTLGAINKQDNTVSILFSQDDENANGLGWYWKEDYAYGRTSLKSFSTKQEAVDSAIRLHKIISN